MYKSRCTAFKLEVTVEDETTHAVVAVIPNFGVLTDFGRAYAYRVNDLCVKLNIIFETRLIEQRLQCAINVMWK